MSIYMLILYVYFCISATPLSLLVNSHSACFFAGSHELRQGDLLSLFRTSLHYL